MTKEREVKEKLLTAVGVVVIVTALGAGAYKCLEYIQEVPARVEGIKAAAIGITCALAAVLLIVSLWVPLPVLWKKFRNK